MARSLSSYRDATRKNTCWVHLRHGGVAVGQIRRELKGVLLKEGLHFQVFPLINVSSLVSTCFVQVEAFVGFEILREL